MKDKISSQLLSRILLRTEFGGHLFYSKLLYRSRAGNHFYGTKFEIWDDFGPASNTEKKLGRRYYVFVFMGKNISFIKKIADFETT